MNGRRLKDMKDAQTIIQEEWAHFKKNYLSTDYSEDCFEFIETRIKNIMFRSYYAMMIFKYCIFYLGDRATSEFETSFFERKFPFVVEMIICIQYYHNKILDMKGGIYLLEDAWPMLIEGNLLKECLYEYIDAECKPFEKEAKDCTREIFKLVDKGQTIEKEKNCLEYYQKGPKIKPSLGKEIETHIDPKAIKRVKNIVEEKGKIENGLFLECYLKRIYLTCGILIIKTTSLIPQLLKLNGAVANGISEFSKYFGMMRQIINDNTDYIPEKHLEATATKLPRDAFADLKNGSITLPTLYYLSNYRQGVIGKALKNKIKTLNKQEQEEIFNEILKVMPQSIETGKELGNFALSYLDPIHPLYDDFKDMVAISKFNKFYKIFFRARKKNNKDDC